MLAALIATRQAVSPIPTVFVYSNQFVAATNTFVCLTVCRRAAHITTSLPIRTTLSLSLPGHESVFDQLNRFYYRIVNYLSSDANMIPLSADLYLSNQIAGAIASATTLTGILATLPILPQNAMFLVRLRASLALALANLQALGKPI